MFFGIMTRHERRNQTPAALLPNKYSDVMPKYHPALNAMDLFLWCFLQLSVAHTEDWGRFARTLMEIRANRADGEEEGPMELAS